MPRQKRPISAITTVVIHHSVAGDDKHSTHETLNAHIEHTNYGYHVTIDDDDVFKNKAAGFDGKATFKQQVPDDEVVWGAMGCNYNGWHIAIDGNTGRTGVTKDEIETLIQVVATKVRRWGWTKADVLGTKTRPSRIQTHNYIGRFVSRTKYVTECPGKPVIDLMDYIRQRIASYLPA